MFAKRLALSALLLAATCAAARAEPPAQPRVLDFTALEKSVGKRGGTLEMLMATQKDISQITIYGNARLVGWDQTFTLQPDILAAVDVEENRIFTLHLREGHKWSDGQPFTSEDFRYWWEDVANKQGSGAVRHPPRDAGGRCRPHLRGRRRPDGPLHLGDGEPAVPDGARRRAPARDLHARPLHEAVAREIR